MGIQVRRLPKDLALLGAIHDVSVTNPPTRKRTETAITRKVADAVFEGWKAQECGRTQAIAWADWIRRRFGDETSLRGLAVEGRSLAAAHLLGAHFTPSDWWNLAQRLVQEGPHQQEWCVFTAYEDAFVRSGRREEGLAWWVDWGVHSCNMADAPYAAGRLGRTLTPQELRTWIETRWSQYATDGFTLGLLEKLGDPELNQRAIGQLARDLMHRLKYIRTSARKLKVKLARTDLAARLERLVAYKMSGASDRVSDHDALEAVVLATCLGPESHEVQGRMSWIHQWVVESALEGDNFAKALRLGRRYQVLVTREQALAYWIRCSDRSDRQIRTSARVAKAHADGLRPKL